jgi:hypothetical protein
MQLASLQLLIDPLLATFLTCPQFPSLVYQKTVTVLRAYFI